ncbi:MAG: hypothetical protein K6A15_07645 [Treponema sp.]|nr:hypothetical protein [Treponema sp.]
MSTIVFIITLCGCQQSSNPPVVIIPPVVTNPTNPTNPENPTSPGNTPTGGDDVIINASNLVFIGQGNETVDSVEYLVKKYADVYLNDPYFYTYYKVYYLNDKVRRVYVCPHGIGSQRDYKYSEFNETECRKGHETEDYIYFENGKKEKYSTIYYDISGDIKQQANYTYYMSGNQKKYEQIFTLSTSSVQTYYDQPYDNSKISGHYSNGGGGLIKFSASCNSNQQVSYFLYYYSSGYLKYYYASGYYYEYADNVTNAPSTDSNVYTSRTAFTNDQALAKINELKAL